MDYYKENANEFIQNTLDIDMSDFYAQFEAYLVPGAKVLDIGCGAGRDLKHFKESSYDASGIEPCVELANFAQNYSNCEVLKTGINDFKTTDKFDGIWACASLLHLTDDELVKAFSNIKKLMQKNATFYCSFKLGDFKGQRGGRYYNDQTLESISRLIASELVIVKSWITEDVRVGHTEKWLNLIIS